VLDGIFDCLFTQFITGTTERISLKICIMLYQKPVIAKSNIKAFFLEYISWREGDTRSPDQGGKSTSFMTLEGS
jgi:hypothetical protein